MAEAKHLFGAVEQDTGMHVIPSHARRGTHYTCPSCRSDVVLRCGTIRVPHFAHKSLKNCSHYDHPGESDIHKEAKAQLCAMLMNRCPVSLENECDVCGDVETHHVRYHEGDMVVTERPVPTGRADVAVVTADDNERYVFEICHTNPTLKDRPEPWFEVKALDVLERTEGNNIFECQRSRTCAKCKRAVKAVSSHILKFGQHKGKSLAEVPISYVEWIANCQQKAMHTLTMLQNNAEVYVEHDIKQVPQHFSIASPDWWKCLSMSKVKKAWNELSVMQRVNGHKVDSSTSVYMTHRESVFVAKKFLTTSCSC